jgi:hypothetical protein
MCNGAPALALDRAGITDSRDITFLAAGPASERRNSAVGGRVDGERYDLYFGSLKLGVVTQSDSDFPNLWGTMAYEPWLSSPPSPEAVRLARFVALNKESTRLVDLEDQADTSREQAAVNAELEAGFMDYVESEDWWLVDRRCRKLAILCPILRGDGDLVWRWDPARG